MAAEEEDVYTKEDLAKIFNPKIFGIGLWVGIHTTAKVSDSTNNQQFYVLFVKDLCQNFRCGACKPHCISNITKDPPEKYLGQKWGMSWHSFNFHNRANKALGKKIMTWSQYAKIYLNSDPEAGGAYCKEGCGDDHPAPAAQNVVQAFAAANTTKKREETIDPRGFKELYKVSKRDPELAHHQRKKRDDDRSKGDTLHVKRGYK
jgi:hypothetical protein